MNQQNIDDHLNTPLGTLPSHQISTSIFLDPNLQRGELPTNAFLDDLIQSTFDGPSLTSIDPPSPPPTAFPEHPEEFHQQSGNNSTAFDDNPHRASLFNSVRQALNFYQDPNWEDNSDDNDESEPLVQERVASVEPTYSSSSVTRIPQQHAQDEEWSPWADKISCTIDIASQLPRSLMSDSDVEVMLWLLECNGVKRVPSLWQMKQARKALRSLWKFNIGRHLGSFGHTYYVLHPSSHVALDFSNPRVRQNLRFYPEDSGAKLQESCQAARWLHEADPHLLTPMYRLGTDDFYIFEATLLKNGILCVPVKFYQKGSEIFFKGWKMEQATVENRSGWIVNQNYEIDEPASSFVLCGTDIQNAYLGPGVPRASEILGFRAVNDSHLELQPWQYPLINPWRVKSKGKRVVSYPVWLYCDDTSGNRSKKWNEHNSFLMVAAGLSREFAHKEENVHFLCTSNTAPPLEMLEGIAEDIGQCQVDGTWVYDCVEKEMILVIIWVLALLGDNPMQAEFACHAGLKAKFFCRVCWVKGKDVSDMEESSIGAGKTETLTGMVDRVLRFMKIGVERTPRETRKYAADMLTNASLNRPLSENQKLRTSTGIKDTHLQYFIDKIESSRKSLTGHLAESATTAVLKQLPSDIQSPIWRIRDLNPHTDTPVEILHVVLLGFVKYFWRDAVERLKDSDKETLKIRLTCLDLTGLDPCIATLRGPTLVQYAGSLVGRDFKILEQIGIFVLYDLLPVHILATWAALSKLIPLIWQPDIENVDYYLAKLEAAIDHFLDCVAQWTPQWFNKQKFHLILHLPKHIRRFGPAILFATEIYESFNAIIRGWSIHSNRLAPSRDIGLHAASLAQIRHILSGGYYSQQLDQENGSTTTVWRTAGARVLELGKQESPITKKLGILRERDPLPGAVKLMKSAALDWVTTEVFKHVTGRLRQLRPQSMFVRFCQSVIVNNHDSITVKSFVIASSAKDNEVTLARVQEILAPPFSHSLPVQVLIQRYCTGRVIMPYAMPNIIPARNVEGHLVFDVVTPSMIFCAVNVQHNCATQKCDLSGQRARFSERERLEGQQPAVKHKVPEDLILNTGKLRDARFIQLFTSPLARLERERTVRNGVQDVLANM